MSYLLTFVASDSASPCTVKHAKETTNILSFYNMECGKKPIWLSKDKAFDLEVSDKPQKAAMEHIRDFLKNDKIDLFLSPITGRRKKLLLADMDSTIVAEETLDELAAYAGIKDQIAEITRRAMEGHLDFHDALRERVGLLKGLEAEKLNETLAETKINDGAKTLVATMRENGATCVLVSGGFTFFTGAIGEETGFHHNHGNQLEIIDNKLTGNVVDPILDKHSKLEYLRSYCKDLNIEALETMTIGDGANDLPMLKAAGLGVGYHAKPLVNDELYNLIIHGDLSAALYAQGYKEEEIIQN